MVKKILFSLLFVAIAASTWKLIRVLNREAPPVSGIEKRVVWTTSRIQGTPDPPDPYGVEVAFDKLRFNEPLAIEAVPDSNKFVVAERQGKLFVFDNRRDAQAELFLDVGREVHGVTFHPQFSENGFVYVTSTEDSMSTSPKGNRLSRYKLKSRDPLRADPASEEVLLEWPSGGHAGGAIQFGPDGFLYLTVGDGSGTAHRDIADFRETGQDLSDLLASMLRIDVDRQDQGLKYAIPKDNPFVGQKDVRGEIWAYGLRNTWRFHFDLETGNLWAGDLGQDLWEEIVLIEKGGNYGWSVEEGNHPFQPNRRRGPTPLLPPVVEHHHSDFHAIVGGWVYYGSQLPELHGAYIYGDFDTGKIWMLRYEDGNVTENRQLADTQTRIVDFGQDADGELYILDHFVGRIYRLTPTLPKDGVQPPFPRKLSETGLFASTADHTPAAGVIPYSVNSPLWSDGTKKERFLAVPGMEQIEYNVVTFPVIVAGAVPGWKFPDGSVLVKTFSLEMEKGNPDSLKRLETRLLHHEAISGNSSWGEQIWHGYTYVWNDEQTDAFLLDKAGEDRMAHRKKSATTGVDLKGR